MDFKKFKKPDLDNIDLPDIDVSEEKVEAVVHNRKIMAPVLFLVVLGIALGGYFGYWVKRPEYSMESMRKAVATHDVALFEKYVDTKSVYQNMVDSVLAADSLGVDAFSTVLAEGIFDDKREETVTAFEKVTLDAVAGKESESGLDSFGIAGKAIQLVCDNIRSEQPAFVLNNMRVISKKEDYTDIRLTFYDVDRKAFLPMDFRMNRTSEGKWKLVKLLNLRELYRKGEYIFDDSIEKLKSAEQEQLAKFAEERKRYIDSFKVLPVEEQKIASLEARKILKQKKALIMKDGMHTKYRFISSLYPRNVKGSLSVYNDFTVDSRTNEVKNAAALVLSVPTNTGDKNLSADFDKIYFYSPDGGFVIDVAAWERAGLCVKGKPVADENGQSTMAFLTTTDGLSDIYKLMSKGDLQIVFRNKNKIVANFMADKKLEDSIANAISVNDIIKNKLAVEAGKFVLHPVKDEDIENAIESDRIKEAEEKVKKQVDEKSADKKAANEKAIDKTENNLDKDKNPEAKEDTSEVNVSTK